MPESGDGGCSSAGNPLQSLISAVSGSSTGSQSRLVQKTGILQEGFRSRPNSSTLAGGDTSITKFINLAPYFSQIPLNNPQISNEAMTRFMNHRYGPNMVRDYPQLAKLSPALQRSWVMDERNWYHHDPDEAFLKQKEVLAMMDQVAINIPGYDLQLCIHPVSGDTLIQLPHSMNLLLDHTFVYVDSEFGRVATKIPPLGTKKFSVRGDLVALRGDLSRETMYVANLAEATSNEPVQSWMQCEGREIIHDFGSSDITVIVDTSCLRDGYLYKLIRDRPHPHPSNLQPEAYPFQPQARRNRQVLQCKKSVLQEQSSTFREFIDARPDIDTVVIQNLKGDTEAYDGEAVEAVMAELLIFMHTGKLNLARFSRLEHFTGPSDMYRYLNFCVDIFEAALRYGVKDLPEVITSIIEHDIAWTPATEDLHDERECPPLKRLVCSLYDLEEAYDDHDDRTTKLKDKFMRKWALAISNISGWDYSRVDERRKEEDGGRGQPCSHLQDLRCSYRGDSGNSIFHDDLREALLSVKGEDEELYEADEGDWQPSWRLRKKQSGVGGGAKL